MKLSDQITRRHLFVAFGAAQQTGTLSAVDLSATRDGSSVTLRASDGSVAPIAGADASSAGVMTAADKTKLDSVPPVKARDFGALSDVPGVALGAAITHLRTAGYASPGDGGGALYKRVGSEPSHAFKVQSADGAWWEGVPDPAGVSVKQFGATGDGATDDRAAVQDAIDYARSSVATSTLDNSRIVRVPKASYSLGSKITLYSGVHLKGEGSRSLIKAAGAFADDRLIDVAGDGTTSAAQWCHITDLGFDDHGLGTVWAIKASTTSVWDNSTIENIWLNSGYGVDTGAYAQALTIRNIFSRGPVDQVLHLKGNHNYITGIDKEGNSGSSADPYVLIENHAAGNSTQNRIGTMLLEGAGSASKSGLKLLNCEGVTIEDFWFEATASNGVMIDIEGCTGHVRFEDYPRHLTSTKKIKVRSSHLVSFAHLSTDAEDLAGLEAWLDFDGSSHIHIEHLLSRRAKDVAKLAQHPNVSIERVTNKQAFADAQTGYVTHLWADDIYGTNLLENGSFEAGSYGWTWATSPDAQESYVQSEFADGLMAKAQWSTSGTRYLRQSVTIPAELVEREITLRAMVKVENAGLGAPYFSGCGLSYSNGYSRADADEGAQIISQTVIPQSSGTLTVGLWFLGLTSASVVKVDECVLSFGSRPILGSNRFQSLELGGRTQVYDTAAPATGTWKQGDIVWNAAPAPGGVIGWVCVTAGSPGVWNGFGNISP